jgi:hypothetical protein
MGRKFGGAAYTEGMASNVLDAVFPPHFVTHVHEEVLVEGLTDLPSLY